MPFIGERSIISPPSIVARPATLWPPPRTAISRPSDRASLHRVDDVRGAAAAGDQRRPFVDEPVVYPPHFVISGIRWLQQDAAKRRYKLGWTDRGSGHDETSQV